MRRAAWGLIFFFGIFAGVVAFDAGAHDAAGDQPDTGASAMTVKKETDWTVVRVVAAGAAAAFLLLLLASVLWGRRLAREIIKRKEAEQGYRTLVEMNPEAIVVHQKGKIVYVNSAAAAFLEAGSADDLTGRRVMDFVHPEYRAAIRRRLARTTEDEAENSTLQQKTLCVSGAVKWSEAVSRQIIYEKQPAVITIARDVTERKSAEEKLLAAKIAAETASRSKSEFLRNMSHELRTPLNAILGYTQILLRDAGLSEAQQDAVHIIHTSGEHLITLIDDILDTAKIESGKIDLQLTDIDLYRFIKNLSDLVSIRARQKSIDFRCEADPDLPPVIVGDEKRLRQILLNLLSNAVKYTDSGHVSFRTEPLGESIRFSVSDTGVGVSAEDLETIFEPFRQLSTSPGKSEGTGLGLAISDRLARRMGGRIAVESVPGKGSTFSFTAWFPASDEKPVPPTSDACGERRAPDGEVDIAVDIVPPPAEDIAAMHDMAVIGDITGLKECVERLKKENSDFIPFADRMMRHIRKFEIKKIKTLISAFRDKEHARA